MMRYMLGTNILCLDLVLVTNNTREFSRVHGLRVENWIPA
jgi:tRNA(fMet)-specific endonuclease VapC